MRVFRQWHSVDYYLKRLMEGQVLILATLDEFQTRLDQLDAVTTNIAAELQALRDQLVGSGLSATDEADVLAKLDAKIVQLQGLGTTP